MKRETLTLKKPARTMEAIDLSMRVGLRFVDRKGRYILQVQITEAELTWVDVPICPEVYGPVKI